MSTKTAIKRAYEIIGEKTPLYTDCGKVCNGACCHGDENAGMWVFPGEDEFLSEFTLKENETNTVAVCNGTCERETRPLSCRIFPLFPMAIVSKRTGRIKIKPMPDPRAIHICPLFRGEYEITEEFKTAVYRAGRVMLRDRRLKKFLLETTDFLTYLYTVREKLK